MTHTQIPTELVETARLEAATSRTANWQRWGPYLSERQWGTVREDYSENQDAWNYFPHDHARSRAYRWGEDGLLGICDRQCRLCFAFAFWNARDPILKERLFGLTGPEGNHGEDVKECYYYLDSSPTHAYMHGLYKYPQQRFPYENLVTESRRRNRIDTEHELLDTGIFDSGYFDCDIHYAKAGPDDILAQCTVTNRGSETATIHVLQQWWYRNTWIWGCDYDGCTLRPVIGREGDRLLARHATLGNWEMACDVASDGTVPIYLFTENETNPHRHPGVPTYGAHFKDAFHRRIVEGQTDAVNPAEQGTKVAGWTAHKLAPGQQVVLRSRMWDSTETSLPRVFGADFDNCLQQRKQETDAFYASKIPSQLNDREQLIARQAYAGLLWTKQFYHYVVEDWLEGDSNYGKQIPGRTFGRNSDWRHLFNRDVISMPDKWEYPWYAAWDLAFHMLPMARIDLDFAKSQLLLFLREWYLHPNGELPAYEWALSDVNPPVHAWACWNVYLASGTPGCCDKEFLARVFQKLLLNFTWWVNRKDPFGNHVFSGGFLGLDNIGVFDRSKPLPTGGSLLQADATAWMAFFCGNMLKISMELAEKGNAYADMASKFLEHYLAIAHAINTMHGTGLWDEQDGFYYDHLDGEGQPQPLKVRSLVGLIPLCAPVVIDERDLERLPDFAKRMEWFLDHRPDVAERMSYLERTCPEGQTLGQRLLAVPNEDRLRRMLRMMLDEGEFLSAYGIRSLSAFHEAHPFRFQAEGYANEIRYVPGESDTYMFGGNSNWRGPIWLPINYLIVESLRTYYQFYGDNLQVECPTGSGTMMNLGQVADEIERRLIRLFEFNEQGQRACHGMEPRYGADGDWRDLVLFYEYFHGDNGRGLGAAHQTGWTALVASMLESQASRRSEHIP